MVVSDLLRVEVRDFDLVTEVLAMAEEGRKFVHSRLDLFQLGQVLRDVVV